MKKYKSILFPIIIFILLSTGCSQKTSKPTVSNDDNIMVYTSFYPMYDFASKIGGDKATVVNMVPSGTEPHDWEPTAADVGNLEKANVFVYNGAGMEHWVEEILGSIKNKELIIVEASKDADIALMKGHKEEDGDKEGKDNADEQFDPHVWLSPINAKHEMENIKNAFVQADPENKDYYEGNYSKYAAEFDKLNKEFEDTLSATTNKDIIVAHEAFGYLCADYGLNQVGIEGLSPDSEPDPARMAEIIDFAKQNNVKVIFFEELVSPKVAETVAKAIGAKTEVLNPIEGLSDEEIANKSDYFSIMRQNMQNLKTALQ